MGSSDATTDSTYEIKAACLFCSSASNLPQSYLDAATKLAVAMKKRGIDLVYGGGDWGLMGQSARAAVANGVHTIGVLPEFMQVSAGEYHGETVFVQTMAERKSKMAEISDCFIGLPGGFGTIDELTEMLTWNQLGLQSKPIGLINVDGFWDAWVAWVKRAEADGMIKDIFVECMFVDEDPERLLERMSQYKPSPDAAKFFTRA